jgi:AraC-like DNA-binding protein
MLGKAHDAQRHAVVSEAVGWDLRGTRATRVLTERVGDGTTFAARTWSTALSARWTASPGNEGWRMLLVLDGEAEVRDRSRSSPVREGDLLLASAGTLDLLSTSPVAVMSAAGLWTGRIARAFGMVSDSGAGYRILRPSRVAIASFAAIVNQGIAGGLQPGQNGFSDYWRAVEHAVGLLGQSGGSWIPEGLSAANTELYRRALVFMERNYQRADLSIAEIGEGAFASASSLFRAFGAAGTTPLGVLRHIRLAAVGELLDLRGADIDDAVLARMTGFSSVPSMLSALGASRMDASHRFVMAGSRGSARIEHRNTHAARRVASATARA